MTLGTRLTARPAALLAAGGVLTLAIGGFAVAAIPSSNGTIHGCYTSRGVGEFELGKLRVIDPDRTSCSPRETAISWDQQGRPGVPGPSGPAGPTGPPGPTPDLSAFSTRLSAAEASISSLASQVAELQNDEPTLSITYSAAAGGTLTIDGFGLRPGAPVVAHLKLPGQPSLAQPAGNVFLNGTYAWAFENFSVQCRNMEQFHLTTVTSGGDPIESNRFGPDCTPL